MSSWIHEGVERVCSGSNLKIGDGPYDTLVCHETPSEVRALMSNPDLDMLELHSHGCPEQPQYVDKSIITAITPYWAVVKTG